MMRFPPSPRVRGEVGAAALEKSWAALGKLDAHKAWGTQMEPYVVSGSSRREIFRVA